MRENLINDLLELRSALAGDPRFLALQKAEADLQGDSIITSLIMRKEEAERDYSSALSYLAKGDPELIRKQTALSQASVALHQNSKVVAYDEAYRVVSYLYLELDDALFGAFQKKSVAGDLS